MTHKFTQQDLLATALTNGMQKITNPLYAASRGDITDFIMDDLPHLLNAAGSFLRLQKLLHSYQGTDGTAAPFWAIAKTGAGGQTIFLAGPFFSRAAAQEQLDARLYHWGAKAFTYAFSACWSDDYKKLLALTMPHPDFRGLGSEVAA